MTIGRRSYRAHRISYEVFRGEKADGMSVCHECDNPLCVNPSHLFLGTSADNTRDMIAKGRQARMVDGQHPNTKITHAEREDIRARRDSGESLKSIASRYGVHFGTISAICTGARSYGTA